MPALDECSPQLIRALEKEHWVVNPKPERKKLEKRVIYIDLLAQHEKKRTYIEVKCFPAAAANTDEEYGAVGQYIIYHTMLTMLEDFTPLYLAVPHTIYNRFDSVMRKVIENNRIKLLVFDVEREEILAWKE